MTLSQTINGKLRKLPAWPLYFFGLLPLGWLAWLIVTGDLGVDPVKTLEHKVGKIGLQFLVATLCVTPLRRFTGVSLIKYRRALGLLSFFYIALHLMVWLGLDIQFRWTEIGADILKRPYITIGMLGFAVMLPLAITSNNLSVRRMGAVAWGKLHKLTYVAAAAGAIHYMMLVKAWPLEPMLYLAGVAALLALRALWSWRRAAARTA
ncbi:protein-methionine-sulfoxide reductase heme-binding subunit MsrQ [Acidimangrovimonas pyrenivorans]|uniref:Protein-methionine-sulfoxide reductase heme-binding subunit MsrQ n=1 Tax=Acidimangrovimonas pyrenivorans TaxID=2030798 RepID=A0ABV7AGR2_9RHOB